ncbi:MAG: PEGA domain-containing protein [Spirochaetes bacterium]|nr:PEGA domain-containing protein [Spirochaetota bacterium]MBU1080337.1 PEGA domain-containing protein [Spirochaetota bacterium]
MKRISSFALLLSILACSPAFSQGLRANVAAIVALSADTGEGSTVSLRYNDAVGILYPADPTFIQGVEFELRIPKAFQGAESSIAWSVFSRVSPSPATDRFDYSVDLVATQPLPARVSMNLVLPIIDRHGIKSGPFASLIPLVAGVDRFPLFFKLSPIGKGLNPSMEAAEFKLTVRPVLRDEGGITVSVTYPEGQEKPGASVFIDDRRVEDPHALIMVKKGARVVRVSAEGYREEIITVPIVAGKTVPLTVAMVPNAPLIEFQAPSGAFISIDGVAVGAAELSGLALEPGEHTLVFKIGDYSMTRKFTALRGKVYRAILSVELDIVTSP